ncbi:MAG: glycosyl hydrolase 115 family protein [Bacteroidales bacterium]
MKKIFLLFLILFSLQSVFASDSFDIIKNGSGANLYYGGGEQVVKTALDMLIGDSKLICDEPMFISDEITDNTIVVGIPEKELYLKELADKYSINVADLAGKWEAYKIQLVQDEGNSYLFVLGSDPRGAAYGVLELSRKMGVSPWVWWADVVPEKKSEFVYEPDGVVHAPSVQFRGVFLNDEDWALMPWSAGTFEPTLNEEAKGNRTYGRLYDFNTNRKNIYKAIGNKTYSRIFELLLRLRANTIWPAMHECTVPFFMVKGNKEVADKYGIVMSTSHAEPMECTNTGEWDKNKYGDFNFLTNKEQVLSYWERRVKQLANSDAIYTMGMRGIHDGRMQGVKSLDEETQVLHTVFEEQRSMLKRHNPEKNIKDVPQIFVPYKEVLKAYDNGLELPDDITLMWCDDNHGHIVRQSNAEEQQRSGGAGVYYHISYWGKPHDYLWLGSTQPGLIYAEMKRAWDNGAKKIWILNVGDIKPSEYLTEFFMDMAWNIDDFSGDKIYEHQHNWVEQTFRNSKANSDIDYILRQYYLLAGQRKPEHMGWNRVEVAELNRKGVKGGWEPVQDSELSPTAFGDEIERRIEAYNDISTISTKIYKKDIADDLKAAYFQLVHYPVSAAAAMNRKVLYAQKSRLYAGQNQKLAAYYADLATDAYNEIAALSYTYNKDMLNGKWNLMMDMKPRDLPVFQEPVLPELPEDIDVETLSLPRPQPLVETAGTPKEGDRMIALNACDYVNNVSLETIECLGHSGKTVRLPVAEKIEKKQIHLEYKIKTESKGKVKIKVGVIPMHSLTGSTEMRYAVVIDNQEPIVVATEAQFLSDKWAENALRNQSLTIFDAYIAEAGEHTVRIYAIDEELFVDQVMIDFDLDRKHYLIPTD